MPGGAILWERHWESGVFSGSGRDRLCIILWACRQQAGKAGKGLMDLG